MNKNKKKPISKSNQIQIIRMIGMITVGVGLLALFSAAIGLYILGLNYEKFLSENPGSLLYSIAKYILSVQIALSISVIISSFFFMLFKSWAKNLLIKTIWGFYLFYIFIGIILVFETNKNINFKNLNSLISIILPLCIVAFMMRYIYIYLNKLVEKIDSEKTSGLFK